MNVMVIRDQAIKKVWEAHDKEEENDWCENCLTLIWGKAKTTF